jgi:spore germination cell wall hydrolase CwlJ-like protein
MSGIDFSADPDTALKRQFAALLMRQGMDASPVQHWTQGAARMSNALVSALMMNDLKEQGTKSRKGLADTLLGDGTAQPASPAAPSQPLSPAASTAGKLYANDEPSPLDPPGGTERDTLARALLAEAGNQGPQGMQGVAEVVRNRAVSGKFGGDTVSGVLNKPYQFEGMKNVNNFSPNSPGYQDALGAIDRTYAGAPTAAPPGSTHFYSPTEQARLAKRDGRAAVPSWDNGKGVDVGDHRFFGGVGSPQVTAGAQPTSFSSQNQRGAPMQPQQPSAAQRTGPEIPAEWRTRLRALIENPATTQYGLQLASQFIKPSTATYGVIGKDEFGTEQYGWIDPIRQTTRPNQTQPGAPGGGAAIPPAPPGVDPKLWRDAHSKRASESSMPASLDDTLKVNNVVRQLPSYKDLASAAPIYKSMTAAAGRNTRASDLNLVYGLGKLFDPGSVVREGEMVMVKNTAGIPDWLAGTINSLNGGAALTPDTRKAIMAEAHSRIQEYKGRFDLDAEQYRGIATRNRMNVDDVIPGFGDFQPWQPPQPPAPPAAPGAAPNPQQVPLNDLLQKYGPR